MTGTEQNAERPPTGPSTLPPAAEAVVRRRRVETKQRRITWWGVGMTVLFLVLLAGLVYLGYQASLRVGGGTEQRESDPDAPGYVAEPRPTTTDLYVVTDDEGGFASALLVVPDGSGQGGTLVPLSPSFVTPEQGEEPPAFLDDLYEQGGIEGLRERLETALDFKIAGAETVPAAALAEVAGTEAVEIANVDNLVAVDEDGTEDVRYPAGTLSLAPEELAAFLAFEGSNDPAPNQVLRAQTVWEELLARAGTRPQTELPVGEQAEDSEGPGFSDALWSLVAGETRFDSVPMAKVPVPGTYFVAWMPDGEKLDAFVARAVPLPQSPSTGSRTPVAILNGTADPDATAATVPVVVAAGGEVTLVGNAESFDIATTTVEYADDASQGTAERIATELGVTSTAGSGMLDGVSVRVVLGADGVQ